MELNIKELIDSADFMAATKNNYRYATSAGELTTEDLWALPEVSPRKNTRSLQQIATHLLAEIKEENDMTAFDAFLENNRSTSSDTRNKLAIVLAVIDAKRKDIKAREAAAMRRQLLDQLQEALAAKENNFSDKSPDELRAMLQDVAGSVERD